MKSHIQKPKIQTLNMKTKKTNSEVFLYLLKLQISSNELVNTSGKLGFNPETLDRRFDFRSPKCSFFVIFPKV